LAVYAASRWASLWLGASAAVAFGIASDEDSRPGWVFAVLALTVVVDSVRGRRQAVKALTTTRAERAVLEERARIARDLHDVVAHSMSMVAVRAETAPYRIKDLSPAAETELREVAATAREALQEVRALLGVLRHGESAPDLAPQAGLAHIDQLAAEVRRAGVPVAVEVSGTARPLRAAVDVGAYRIVREALANGVRHGDGSGVRVDVAYQSDAVHLMVSNAALPGTGRGVGHGLLGMRERASAAGGTLQAGEDVGGRFVVDATLPYDRAGR
jgi:signal transduction histidine kinase